MGKCIICNCDTDDYRAYVREENGESFHDYQCEECTLKIVEKERKEYIFKFNKVALPYLIKNNFRVQVKCIIGEKEAIEEFPIKDAMFMDCVDVIRERMKDKEYYESWIDVHWESYEDVEFEVVDYLCYSPKISKINNNNDCDSEKEDDDTDEDCIAFWLEVIGNNDLTLKKSYS